MPFSTRGFTTLWKGQWNGNPVAIKMLRLGPDDDLNKIAAVSCNPGDLFRLLTFRTTPVQRFCREVLLWPRLHHANVLPVHGFSLSTIPLCVVSPWMENGNILEYTRKHPEVNRMSLVSPVPPRPKICIHLVSQLVDVAYGLRYLHKIDQVHGNIRGVSTHHTRRHAHRPEYTPG